VVFANRPYRFWQTYRTFSPGFSAMLRLGMTTTAGWLVVSAAVVCLGPEANGQQRPSPIRSGIVLVPIDVRVVDANGEPVTDLTAADFTVYENGVRQEIAHFVPVSFSGARDDIPRLELGADHPLAAATPGYRTFIILLGRGRLNAPIKGLEGLIAFVKDLLPTDRVGVVAYLRASEPSTDHQAVIRFLEQYRNEHEDLEGRIRSDFRHTGFDVVRLTNDTRRRIDALFGSEGIPAFSDLPGATGQNASRYLDLTYVRRTLEVARRLPGEKHLIVLSERPFGVGRIHENPDRNLLVKWANEARVALSYIHAGGLSGMSMIRGKLVISPRDSGSLDASAMGISDRDFFAPTDYGLLASYTGGISAFYKYAASPLAELDRGSRFQYLLGYYPSVATAPDTYRTVRVMVNRPEVTPQYRHGYRFASSPDDEIEFRQALGEDAVGRALARLAGTLPKSTLKAPVRSLKISTSKQRYLAGAKELLLSIAFDPMRIAFTFDGARHRATLYLKVFVDDAEGQVVGELSRPLELALSAEESARAKKHWLSVDVTVPLEGSPARVRAALYDYENDRTIAGTSAIQPVPR
jgi:VWFA-related protein